MENQLVTAGQEALQQEQKTADLLREQLAKVKGSVDSNLAESTTTNNEDGKGSSSNLLTTPRPNNACTAGTTTTNNTTSSAKTPTKLGSVASLDLSNTDQQHPSPSPSS